MGMPVSGPGAYSQRTDKQPINVPTGLPYGDAQQLHATEAASPMSATPSAPNIDLSSVLGGAGAAPSFPPAQPPPFIHEPSQRPGEPVTHGADLGPGADSSILTASTAPPVGGVVSQAIARAAAADTSGTLQQLLLAAQSRGL